MTDTNQPVQKLKDKGLVVTIWKNETDGKTFYNTSIEKRYLKNEQWESTTVFNQMDLLIASRLLAKAYDAIVTLKQS